MKVKEWKGEANDTWMEVNGSELKQWEAEWEEQKADQKQ